MCQNLNLFEYVLKALPKKVQKEQNKIKKSIPTIKIFQQHIEIHVLGRA